MEGPGFNAHPSSKQVTSRVKVLTKLNEDCLINRQQAPDSNVFQKNHFLMLTRKTAPPPCGHFHEGWSINVYYSHITKLPTNWSHSQTKQTYHKKNCSDKVSLRLFYRDWTINVAARETDEAQRTKGDHMSNLRSELQNIKNVNL
ncbi:hypothetical protein DPMN_063257 [Dreissena polymorpha]|uniref:Uncharacterized protein n=1 Tax=Dreissena polymorpha TaxID=45954 RepID=A0A9D4CB70_DREPO|nr:hypothetical protein DPMN_063257 [Dreissena polymorpha]